VLTSNYAASLYSSGNTEEALEYAKRSVDLSPDLGNQYTLGVIYQEREQYAAAVAAYQKAIQAYKTQSVHTIDTDSKLRSVDDVRLEDIYDSLALIYHLQGRPFDAIHSLEEGLIKFPLSSRLYFTMALAQYEVGNREGALAAITKSYQISPKEASKTILFRLKNNLPLH
jgi:tetratricopeptide (TPR) repeat protein